MFGGTSEQSTVTLHDVRVSGGLDYGMGLERTTLFAEGIVVEGVVEPGAYAAVALNLVDATFTDSIIQDNITDQGGITALNSPVVFQGGAVRRNESNAHEGSSWVGGGAVVRHAGVAPPDVFEIIDSDWGQGEAEENAPFDVVCVNSLSQGGTASWLGGDAAASCVWPTVGCCTATE